MWWDEAGVERPKYVLRFWFEWLTHTAFWPASDVARAAFGIGPNAVEKLPLSATTRERAREVATWHDLALNWDSPADPGPSDQEECDRFNAAVADLFREVIREVGEAFEVVYAQPPARPDVAQ
jgi:hypothetical protein